MSYKRAKSMWPGLRFYLNLLQRLASGPALDALPVRCRWHRPLPRGAQRVARLVRRPVLVLARLAGRRVLQLARLQGRDEGRGKCVFSKASFYAGKV